MRETWIQMKLWYRLICALGLHKWCYDQQETHRHCLRCGKRQRLSWTWWGYYPGDWHWVDEGRRGE